MKQPYSAPKLTELGSVRELTLGTRTGNVTDRSFPAQTPISSQTFS
jgi:hypothetical protein